MVAACDSAFYGDRETLSCLRVVAGTRYRPTELIAWCDQSNYGDAETLACIDRY